MTLTALRPRAAVTAGEDRKDRVVIEKTRRDPRQHLVTVLALGLEAARTVVRGRNLLVVGTMAIDTLRSSLPKVGVRHPRVTALAIEQYVSAHQRKVRPRVNVICVEDAPAISRVAYLACRAETPTVNILVTGSARILDFTEILDVVAEQTVHATVTAPQRKLRRVVVEPDFFERSRHVAFVARAG